MNTGASLSLTSIALIALSAASASAGPRDPCSVLSPGQVGAAVGAPLAAGSGSAHACTWNATDKGASGVNAASLFLQSATSYEEGKKLVIMAQPRAMTALAGVGDDAYYFTAGTTVGLLVKKGPNAFKVSVYGSASLDKKKAMEKAMAAAVLSKL